VAPPVLAALGAAAAFLLPRAPTLALPPLVPPRFLAHFTSAGGGSSGTGTGSLDGSGGGGDGYGRNGSGGGPSALLPLDALLPPLSLAEEVRLDDARNLLARLQPLFLLDPAYPDRGAGAGAGAHNASDTPATEASRAVLAAGLAALAQLLRARLADPVVLGPSRRPPPLLPALLDVAAAAAEHAAATAAGDPSSSSSPPLPPPSSPFSSYRASPRPERFAVPGLVPGLSPAETEALLVLAARALGRAAEATQARLDPTLGSALAASLARALGEGGLRLRK